MPRITGSVSIEGLLVDWAVQQPVELPRPGVSEFFPAELALVLKLRPGHRRAAAPPGLHLAGGRRTGCRPRTAGRERAG